MIDRLVAWGLGLSDVATFELRCKGDIVDSATVEDCTVETLTDLFTSFDESADEYTQEEGRTCVFNIVGIADRETGKAQAYPCMLRIRKRANKGDVELVRTLSQQVTELHKSLMRKEKEAHSILLATCERLARRNEDLEDRSNEVLTRLETLRTCELERRMLEEKHAKDLEVKDRITGAAVPLMMAIGNKVMGNGMLPAPDINAQSLTEIARSMTDEQITTIESIVGAKTPDLGEFLANAVDGRVNLEQFKSIVDRLTQQELMAVVSVLNMGQQAAITEVLQRL
jgi:hypothetical protein